ncbi:MAG: cation transporter, partial [Bacteroidetes bacterium SW_10_40_5]
MMHDHNHGAGNYGKAFALGIFLNVLFVGVEVYYGLIINSSALLADAGHNFSDVISLVLPWVAACLAQKQSTRKFTYGFRKTKILASLINGLLIVGASGFILYDAIQKFQNPVEIPGNTMMLVAAIGIVVNTGTALLFVKGRNQDLNIKGAFLHMAADAAVTLGVLIGGIIMKYTGTY